MKRTGGITVDTQEQERRPDELAYIALLERGYGVCSELIDTLVDMVYLATADEEFLTPDVTEWLDRLQDHAQKVAERMAPAIAED
jgi:hypothetical protein